MRDTLAFQRLTEGQRHALRTDGFGLINAVAGSGKTTQLVALTLKALLDDHDLTLDKLAIITFTRKAGAELRGRLRQAMEKESAHCPERAAFWAERLAQLPAAPIGTIDALVQQILRRMATEGSDTLPLDPAFAVHDEARTSLLIHRALAQVLENPDVMGNGPLAPSPRCRARGSTTPTRWICCCPATGWSGRISGPPWSQPLTVSSKTPPANCTSEPPRALGQSVLSRKIIMSKPTQPSAALAP